MSHSLPGRKLTRNLTELHTSSDHHQQKLRFIAQQQECPRPSPTSPNNNNFSRQTSLSRPFSRLRKKGSWIHTVTILRGGSSSSPAVTIPRCPLFSAGSCRRRFFFRGSLVPLPQRQRKPHHSERRSRAPHVLLRDAVHHAAVHERPPLDPREQCQVRRVLLLLLLIRALASGPYAGCGAPSPLLVVFLRRRGGRLPEDLPASTKASLMRPQASAGTSRSRRRRHPPYLRRRRPPPPLKKTTPPCR
ncbi:unnamed protein product [Ectocarpus fasciculatus]